MMYFLMLCAVFYIAWRVADLYEVVAFIATKTSPAGAKYFARCFLFAVCVTFLFYNAW